jgi:hypothetical protein
LIKTDSDKEVFAVTEDHQIKEVTKNREVFRYEASNMFSSLVSLQGNKVLFAGVADHDRPGSIHVLKHPWEKAFEIQAHSLPVEKMKVSYDN